MRVAASPRSEQPFCEPLRDPNGRVDCFVPVISNSAQAAPCVDVGGAPAGTVPGSPAGVPADFAKAFPLFIIEGGRS
jgi:hypothetical protein